MTAATSLGAFFSYIPGSYIADLFGRKVCIGVGSVLLVIATVVQVVVQNNWAFFGTRILSGFAAGLASAAAPLLVAEISHPRYRQTATALYNAFWCLGAITSASITFATLHMASSWSWKAPCIFQASFPLAQLAALPIIPESPRWLVAKNRRPEALAILGKYHSNGDSQDELVQREFEEICESIGLEKSGRVGCWYSFFSSKGNMHRLAICVLVGIMQEWAGNGKRCQKVLSIKHILTNLRDDFLLFGTHPFLCRNIACI